MPLIWQKDINTGIFWHYAHKIRLVPENGRYRIEYRLPGKPRYAMYRSDSRHRLFELEGAKRRASAQVAPLFSRESAGVA